MGAKEGAWVWTLESLCNFYIAFFIKVFFFFNFNFLGNLLFDGGEKLLHG